LGYPSTHADKAMFHMINRDASERYYVAILDNDLKVFDLAGNEKIVAFPNGKGYLTSSNPRKDFKIITIADYSFIVNVTKTVTMRADVAPGSIVASKQLFGDLPGVADEGAVYEIAGDPANKFDNYFVKRTGGVYIETVKPGVQLGFDATTMPHALRRLADGTFEFISGTGTWADRSVGDEQSSPTPSFVGNKISDIFFHRNRLGFSSRENVIFSRAGDFYNFWRESVMDVLDSDPVDVSVAHSRVSNIEHTIAFNKSLLLFSQQTQFILTGADALTPKTVKIDQSTEFETSPIVRPVGAGPNIYFVTDKGDSSGVREYYVSEDTVTNDAADITRHVPTYIPSGVFKIIASSTEDVLFLLNDTAPNTVFIYKYYWQGDEKKQAAWGKWTFGTTDKVLAMEMIGTVAYLMIHRTDGFYMEKIDLQPNLVDSPGYRVHLDRKVWMTGTYNSVTGYTHWILPFSETGTIECVLGSGYGSDAGSQLAVTKVSNDEIKALGNYPGLVYIGRKYDMMYRFSEQNIKLNGVSVLGTKLQMRTLTVDFVSTGNFNIVIVPKGRSTYTYPYAGKVLGSGNIILGKPHIDSGRYRVPVQARPDQVTIEIQNDTPMPCALQSAEWEAFYIQRADPK
jgi:hypothetical protein